jgi:uncharacterized protein (DUF2141 family)
MRRIPVLLISTALALPIFVRAQGAPAPAAPLSVHVLNLRSNQGQVGCTLFDSEKGFPKDADKALQRRWCPIAGNAATCSFNPISQGTYAVACFHDENGNGKLDTKIFGIPTEGTAASNGARGHHGPPRYQDAKFQFSGTATMLELPIGYY